MPKKLYTVKVEFDFVIVADNEKHAEVVGRSSLKEAFNDVSYPGLNAGA